LYTENHRFSKGIAAGLSGYVSLSNLIVLIVIVVVCQFLFNDRRRCGMARSRGTTRTGAGGMSWMEPKTERALIEGTVLAPMPKATAFEAS